MERSKRSALALSNSWRVTGSERASPSSARQCTSRLSWLLNLILASSAAMAKPLLSHLPPLQGLLRLRDLLRPSQLALQELQHPPVKIRSAEVVVPRNAQDIHRLAIHVQKRRVQRAAADVVNQHMPHTRGLVQVIGHGSRGGFLQYPHYLETCQLEGLLRGLDLPGFKFCGHADDSPVDGVP
mmetsp:Transcript_72313/g.224540  ORF Transcript_72313/g.224540 Transcript_72313/m.224540 type:complete len:183 (-) Transcript_72313:549-1097(-)